MFSVIYCDRFLDHQTGRFHPEHPERLTAIVYAFKAVPWANQLTWHVPTPIENRDLLPLLKQIHDHKYIQKVQTIAQEGGGALDADTPISPHSYDVALLAVSAWCDGIDRILETDDPALILARPPGHHAESKRGMGFCLFSNAAIAAHYALEQLGIERVAILDWDVHHGNGTQEIVQNHPQIAYCSLHQSPCYPGTGHPQEKGMYNNVLNLPMVPGSTLAEYQPAFEQQVIPFLQNFQPDLLIVSAGYDGNHDDPLAEISLQPSDYAFFTRCCLSITRRIMFGLEGGYDLHSLSQSAIATVEACIQV